MEEPPSDACAGCGRPLLLEDPVPALTSGKARYHLTCAPSQVVQAAADEYRAILRKGVRYFIEKYGRSSDSTSDPGAQFLALGRAVEEEHARRTKLARENSPRRPRR
jgi:hypothetical protein